MSENTPTICEDCTEGFHGDCTGYASGLCDCTCPDAIAGRRLHPEGAEL